MDTLPHEVLDRIACYSDDRSSGRDLSALGLVSVRTSQAVAAYRARHPLLTSSAQVTRYLERSCDAHTLKLARGTRVRLEKRKPDRGRTTVVCEVEDSVSEDDLVQLCRRNRHLVAIELVEPAFCSLRRRQISFASSLDNLRALSIVGRPSLTDGPAAGFSLTTVGRIVSELPRLCRLALGNIRANPSSLAGISAPSFRLSSFSLFAPAPFLSPSQLSWFLASSTQHESLRTIHLDLAASVLPYQLHCVYWAPIRVTSLYLSTGNTSAIEHLPRHLPHLERYEFRSVSTDRPVDARTLLASARRYDRLRRVQDHTVVGLLSRGLDLMTLAEGLLVHRPGEVPIERVTIRTGRQREDGFGEARKVCRALGIEFESLDELGPEQQAGVTTS